MFLGLRGGELRIGMIHWMLALSFLLLLLLLFFSFLLFVLLFLAFAPPRSLC
jgi:hypothetical protein